MIMAKDSHGNYVKIEDIKQQDCFNGISPIDFKSNGDNLKNYRIYGNTVNGESVGDRTRNLFDGIVTNEIIQNDGSTSSNNNWRCSDFIRSDSTSITLSWESNSGYFQAKVAYYSSDKTFISLENVGKNNTFQKSFVLPSGASVIRLAYSVTVNGSPANRENIMLNSGSTALPYEPYGYKIPVKIEGKNLLQNTATSQIINGVTFTVNEDGSVTCDGQATALTRFNILPQLGGGYDIISGNFIINGAPSATGAMMAIDINGTGIQVVDNLSYNGTVTRLYIQINNGISVNNVKFYPMIRKANISDDKYEPYQTPVTTNLYLPEQIKMVGDEAEYVDYKKQKQYRVRKNIFSGFIQGIRLNTGTGTEESNNTSYTTDYLPVEANTLYTYSGGSDRISVTLFAYDSLKKYIGRTTNVVRTTDIFWMSTNISGLYTTFRANLTGNNNPIKYIRVTYVDAGDSLVNDENIMLNSGSTALPYEPYIENTEVDVTIPALPTLSGTNTLSVNTNIKPSKVWGGLNDLRDILYVKDKLGNILFSKYYEIEDEPPLTYKAKKTGTLKNYRIYGNTVGGESVGDRTANLFDGKFLQGYWAGADGNFAASTKWICTQKIPCKANTDYTFTFGNKSRWYGFAWYDIDSNYIESNGIAIPTQPTIFTVTSPVDAAFMVVNIAGYPDNSSNITPSDVTDLMLVEGSTALPYEPYGYKVPVTVEGKNLLKNTTTSQTINGVTFTVNSDGTVTCNTNENGATNNTFFSIPISLFANTLYKLSGCPSNGSNNSYRVDIRMTDTVIRDKNGTYVVDQGRGITFLLLNDIAFADVKIRIASGYVCDNLTFYPMIRKADITDDTYEPYHVPVTTPIYLPEQIKKVGDEAEYINYKEQKQHRVRKNLLNYSSIEIGRFDFSTGEKVPDSSQFRTSTPIKVKPNESYAISGVASGQVRVFLYDGNMNMISTVLRSDNSVVETTGSTVFVNVAGIKSAWSEQIQLEIGSEATGYEPYIEDTELDITLPALPTLSGTNTLSVKTEVQPSDIYLKGKIEKKPKIYYYSQDGQTLLYTESVLKGGNGTYSTTPTKPSTAQYTYTFVGWAA